MNAQDNRIKIEQLKTEIGNTDSPKRKKDLQRAINRCRRKERQKEKERQLENEINERAFEADVTMAGRF